MIVCCLEMEVIGKNILSQYTTHTSPLHARLNMYSEPLN